MISLRNGFYFSTIASVLSLLGACGGGSNSSPASVSQQSVSPATATVPAESAPQQTAATSSSTSVIAVTTETLLKSGQQWAIPYIKMVGGVAIRIKGTVENAFIGPVQIEGAKFGVFTESGAIVRNLSIANLYATELQREGIRLRGTVNKVNIRDFNLKMRAQPQVSPDLPVGITLYEGQNITISDGVTSGFQMAYVPGTYTNGDGISSERLVDSLLIERVTSTDNSDAGFDLKSTNTVLNDTRAERNKRNYRFWGTVRTGTITSVDPIYSSSAAHVWAGNGAEVYIAKLVVQSSNMSPVLYLEGAKSVTIGECVLNVPAGTVFLKGGTGTVMNFGPGCKL